MIIINPIIILGVNTAYSIFLLNLYVSATTIKDITYIILTIKPSMREEPIYKLVLLYGENKQDSIRENMYISTNK